MKYAHADSPSVLFPWSLQILFLAAAAAVYVVLQDASYRYVIVASLALSAFVVLLAGERGQRVGFLVWVATLGLGYRTIAITPALRIHPAELVLWALLLRLLVRAIFQDRETASLWLPGWLLLFACFWPWGWLVGLDAGLHWDEMLDEFRNFLLLIPLFLVAGNVLAGKERWRPVLLGFWLVSTGVAAIGVVQYLFPSLTQLFPGYMTGPVARKTAEGFDRAEFSFWGSPTATYLCAMALPTVIALWRWWPGSWERALATAAFLVQLAAVYIGGYRSLWLLVALQLLLYLLVSRRYALAGILLAAGITGFAVLPGSTQRRVDSLVLILQARPADSSGIKHWQRAEYAYQLALDRPLGNGWSASGWVHSDFLQVAANLGLGAGLIFAGSYAAALVRLWSAVTQRPRSGPGSSLGIVLLLSFVAAGGLLVVQGVEMLTQLILPVWFVWVLVELYLKETSAERRSATIASYLRPVADL